MPKTFYRAVPYDLPDVLPARPGSEVAQLRAAVAVAADAVEAARARRRGVADQLLPLRAEIAAGKAAGAGEGAILAGVVAERRRDALQGELSTRDAEVARAEQGLRVAREAASREENNLHRALLDLPLAVASAPQRANDVRALCSSIERLSGYTAEELSSYGE